MTLCLGLCFQECEACPNHDHPGMIVEMDSEHGHNLI